MSSHQSEAITIVNGEITVDAELLAPKLGLSAVALKVEMRKGSIYSVAEAAVGDYPVETMEAMARICLKAEAEGEDHMIDRRTVAQKFSRIVQSIAMSALFAAPHLKVKAIVALTQSGSTPLWMSRMNAGVPIFAMTPLPETLSKVTLFSGVHQIAFESNSTDYSQDYYQTLRDAEDELTRLKLVAKGDLMVMPIGESIGQSGHTNTMKSVKVGNHHKH
jgi:pyruvate kinase